VGLTHAQIASRRLARATVGYEVEADLTSGVMRESGARGILVYCAGMTSP
jgi:hypothetical protein